jgi:hypothetical protein
MKPGFRGVLGAGLVIGLCLVALVAVPASAASVAFGAKLTPQSQPFNSKVSCHSQAPGQGIPSDGICTWVGLESFENGSNAQAPKTGTLHHLKIVACNAGSFQLQLVKENSSHHAVLDHAGPTIKYAADPRGSANCGGINQDDYIVQTFAISVPVTKGDFIAVKAKALDALHCSGDDVQLYYPPLSSTTTFRTKKGDAGCDLLIRLIY